MSQRIYSLVFAFLTLAGCNQLDLVPVSSKSVEGFYRTEAHFNQAAIGLYSGLRGVWVTSQSSYMMTEARSDNAFQGTAYDDGPISRFQETSILPVLNSVWSSYYSNINSCNRILEQVGNAEISDEKRKQYEGEARFVRALLYFDLVRYFGGVPLVTMPLSIQESHDAKRFSIEEVYNLIVEDLQAASELLPAVYEGSDKGRATRWAAKGYLGKVYVFRSGYPLFKGEWGLARDTFKELIDSGQFRFFERYDDNYLHEYEGGQQQVFSIQFRSGVGGHGNPFPTRNASNDIAPVPQSQGGLEFGGSPFNLFLSDDLVRSFDEKDLRRSVSIRYSWLHRSGETITTLPTCKKYQNGPVAAANDWDIDWIALSYTDVLMMYAESLNELGYSATGDAFEILNRVRIRAGLESKTMEDVPNQEAYRLWMERERRHELCFENLRWFDLVRTDRALDVMGSFLAQYGLGGLGSRERYLYPIPQPVRDVTPHIDQNPGY